MEVVQIDRILDTYLTELRVRLGSKLVQVWLFGSQARRDAKEGSDFDLLVIAQGPRGQIKAEIREAEWACMEQFNALVATILYTPETWAQARNSPLGWNVLREGRLVA